MPLQELTWLVAIVGRGEEARMPLQELAWLVAIVGGPITAFLGLRQAFRADRQRREELRWRQANTAREMLGQAFTNPAVRAALTLLDWDNREYEVRPGKFEPINQEQMRRALRVPGQRDESFTPREAFVRDCFDQLFDTLDRLQQALRQGSVDTAAIRFEDVQPPLEYWVNSLRAHRDATEPYARAYGYTLALDFLERFPGWRQAGDAAAAPPLPVGRPTGQRTPVS